MWRHHPWLLATWLAFVGMPAVAATINYTTPGTYTYTVPAGAYQLQVQVAGAGGGGGGQDNQGTNGLGGTGGRITAVIPVSPGQVFSGTVGRGGGGGMSSSNQQPCSVSRGGAGGTPGVGAGGAGGNSGCTGFSGGGGGGGGGAVFSGAGFVIQAAGGGGGGGGSANRRGADGANASAISINPADCGRAGNGSVGVGASSDGGGGGGGGGGYSGGGGGNAGLDDRLGGISSGGGAGGGSCYSAGATAFVSVAFQAGGGAVGGRNVGAEGSNGYLTLTDIQGAPVISTRKTADTAGPVKVDDVITYTLTTDVSNSQLTAAYPLTDTLGAGLSFGAVINAGAYTCSASGSVLSCTLPAGTMPGTYAATYTATVNDQATGSIRNAVGATGCTGNCVVDIPVAAAATRTTKTANTAGPVKLGDVITYTLITDVSNSQLATAYPLTDTLGAGLSFGAVINAGAYACSAVGNVLSCTLPAGTMPGTYAATYTATVSDQATGSVRNAVSATGCAGNCIVDIPVAAAATRTTKTADTAGPVKVGDVITYTLTTDVSNSQLTVAYPLTDTLGAGLSFGAVAHAGAYTCSASGNVLSCTLPAGTMPGTYAATYTATVNDQATGSVRNAVSGTGCAGNCVVDIPVAAATTRIVKTADTAGPVKVGDVITYTLTTDVSNSQLTTVYPLTDTLGTGLSFGAVTNAGAYTCSASGSGNVLSCTLPAGTMPGTYAATYTAIVSDQATGSVRNAVSGTGCAGNCVVDIPVLDARVTYRKTANAVGPVQSNDIIVYTLIMEVSNSQLAAPYTMIDTLGTGLSFGSVTNAGEYACGFSGDTLACTLTAGTAPGTYSIDYTATVNAQAGNSVRNTVTVAGPHQPACADVCTIDMDVTAPEVRVTKVAGVREVTVGDLIPYTIKVENTGARDLVSGHAVDTPPAGFAYVEGSLHVSGADAQVAVSGQNPLRFDGIDVPAGQRAALTYLMRVDAGVRPGARINQVQVYSDSDTPISNVATAEVTVSGAPLLEDSLVFGTVFHDRNGNGWQNEDEPGVPGVRMASVEGLLVETDQYGRYHLAGIPGGGERGRNFILKLDPATLPPGATFTTDNPLLRRLTPGMPVRFDWGVQLPEQSMEGGTQATE